MNSFRIGEQVYANQEEFVRRGRRCAARKWGASEIERVQREIRRFRRGNRVYDESADEVVVPVQFIHLCCDEEGRVDESTRERQIEILNGAFSAHRFRFEYEPLTAKSEDNRDWYEMTPRSAEERAAKRALSVDPEEYLNLYTAEPADEILGWSSFPADLAGDPENDGVVLRHSTLPGGRGAAPYDLGCNAVHQVGHWLGLLHTFQDGCELHRDLAHDAPAHAGPNIGRPARGMAHNACSSGARAPIHNFMNFVDDEWMSNFTMAQGARMRQHAGLYRSRLLSARSAELFRRLAPPLRE